MKRVDVKVTFQCNNHCRFCVREDKESLSQDKTAHEIKAILQSSRASCTEAIFTGGEPTIRPDIIELVSFAKNLDYKIQIQTNGRMFAYKVFCKNIINAGAQTFAVSVHGHNAQIHDYLTNVKGSFKQTVLGIKNLLSFKKMVVTNTVINKINFRFLPQIAKFLINLGVSQYQFAFVHILGSAFSNRKMIVPRKNEVAPYLRKGLELGIKNKCIPKVEAVPYCFLAGYEDCIAEKDIVYTKVFDRRLVLNDFHHWMKNEGKLKGPKCKECKYIRCCHGPWREYPRIFGWDEFTPVK